MDIKLGRLNLTKEQLKRSNDLKSEVFRGLSQTEDGDVVAVLTREISKEETDSLKSSLVGLSTEPIPEKTPEEIKKEQDYDKALDKIATAAGLSKDEKDALKEKERANVKKIK